MWSAYSTMKLLVLLLLVEASVSSMSRPNPREMLDLGGNGRKIIHIILENFPREAYAVVSIGDPPVKAKLHIDCGSDLTWVLHSPRYGYNPSRSSSFNYRICAGLSKSPYVRKSKENGKCNYFQLLGDDAIYEGTLGSETFTFENVDGGLGMFNNVLFGFGRAHLMEQLGSGTLGLNVGKLSIVKHFGKKFSICIGNFTDHRRGKHFLALGDDAVFGGKVLSLDTKENDYRINLSSIIIDGESLGIENVLSKAITILDTGTSTISLAKNVYHVFTEKIKKKMSDAGYVESDMYEDDRMICYMKKIPEHEKLQVTFKIDEEIVKMKTTELFVQTSKNHFCLSVLESPIGKNIMGLPLFQGRNIGFDVPNEKVYIKEIECHKLDDNYKDELDHPNP